ncbi:DUF3604 domain-containing protein [Ruegeria sp. HKCCA4008]|uniref:DUF3604 domain-containing protein n=1 Tax=Ruegeria sp. HKCCA4008 TaxID=2682999 RepID=UPI00148A0B60|nr:DUF3604 domain-containing protein [Ruegeria sp. HKCCA4008]
MLKQLLIGTTVIIWAPSATLSQEIAPGPEDFTNPPATYSPFARHGARSNDFAAGLYWGDTHLHTMFSTDAGMIGNTLTPEDAYRFARGEEVITSSGQPVRIGRPLDFLVVADHAEYLGVPIMLEEANPDLLATEYGRQLYDLVQSGEGYEAYIRLVEGVAQNRDFINQPKITRTIWNRQIELAEQYNDPGNFTAFIGFEWSSLNTLETPSNLHRVVVFKDGGEKASRVVPFASFDSVDPEDLWAYMQNYEDLTAGSVLAIPHNGNLSNGLMFATERLNGEPIDAEYASTRMRWEPLIEVTQIKGDGETHPALSLNDEFADYGTWDKSDIVGLAPKTPEMLPFEYSRSALQVGLQQMLRLGVNPFKFGQIGSTDSHTSVATARDDNFWGKTPYSEPSSDRWENYIVQSLSGDDSLSSFEYETIASGLAGVWARENSRAAIFDAMQAKEVYATTGSRIVVRFFGGWKYTDSDVYRPDVVEVGYRKGVPMGGDLTAAPDATSPPTFMVGALRDPQGANLDRIQIIKGWVNAAGERQERIFDIALSDNREIGPEGRATSSVGSTVDEANATYSNSIGDAELRALWVDPDFDPSVPAVYYARVLEIPTPTWQAYDENFYGITMTADVPRSHQERAYTSPIWYTPRR